MDSYSPLQYLAFSKKSGKQESYIKYLNQGHRWARRAHVSQRAGDGDQLDGETIFHLFIDDVVISAFVYK